MGFVIDGSGDHGGFGFFFFEAVAFTSDPEFVDTAIMGDFLRPFVAEGEVVFNFGFDHLREGIGGEVIEGALIEVGEVLIAEGDKGVGVEVIVGDAIVFDEALFVGKARIFDKFHIALPIACVASGFVTAGDSAEGEPKHHVFDEGRKVEVEGDQAAIGTGVGEVDGMDAALVVDKHLARIVIPLVEGIDEAGNVGGFAIMFGGEEVEFDGLVFIS